MRFKIETSLLLTAWLCIGPLSQAQEKITYQDHIHPLFENACNSCHNADKAKGGLDLSSYANTLKGGSGGAARAGRAGRQPLQPHDGAAAHGRRPRTGVRPPAKRRNVPGHPHRACSPAIATPITSDLPSDAVESSGEAGGCV